MTKIINNDPISIYGDGSTSRDYTYVSDIVNGIINSLSYKETNFEIFNLGNSSPIQLIELVKLIEISLNKKAILNFESLQKGDVPITYADISKSINKLNYNPITTLEKGLLEMAKWIATK